MQDHMCYHKVITTMHLSKTAGYAIHALSCIESVGCQPRFIRDIAECTGIHKPYLAKIVNQLAHRGLVNAKRGYRGGITLARPPEEVTLLQIVEAVEGDHWISSCMFGLQTCPANHECPAHAAWQRIREQIEALLRDTTLADVIRVSQAALARSRGKPTKSGAKPALPLADLLCECHPAA